MKKLQEKIEFLEKSIKKIEKRNKKVEADKSWETSNFRKVSVAIKRARHLALLPYQSDLLK